MYSTDDGRTGYPGDVSYFSSDFLLGGPEASERCSSPTMKRLVPPRPPCTRNIEVQT